MSKPDLRIMRGGGYWELLAQLVDELTVVQRKDPQLYQEVRGLLRRARAGTLRWRHEFMFPMQAVARRHEFGELKLEQAGQQHRMYFAEPEHRENLLLGLLYGTKTGRAGEREQQNIDIRNAESRYVQWLMD